MSTTYRFKSDFMRRLQAEAEAEARAKVEAEVRARAEAERKAEDVLAILAVRAIDTPDDAREHITSCTDVDQLDEWVRRATATSIDEVFN